LVFIILTDVFVSENVPFSLVSARSPVDLRETRAFFSGSFVSASRTVPVICVADCTTFKRENTKKRSIAACEDISESLR
jgi:hypothetical protein